MSSIATSRIAAPPRAPAAALTASTVPKAVLRFVVLALATILTIGGRTVCKRLRQSPAGFLPIRR
jgi:hypothetical protein